MVAVTWEYLADCKWRKGSDFFPIKHWRDAQLYIAYQQNNPYIRNLRIWY